MLELVLHDPFIEFSLMFLVVFIVASAMRLLRQPFIVGFIITGIIFSPQLLGLSQVNNLVVVSSQLGVSLLLFIAGLHLNPYYLKTDGKAIVAVGLSQITFTMLLAYGLAQYLGIGGLGSLYIALALTLSSTIVSLKLLADKKVLTHLHARLSIGILLIQDIVVSVALVFFNALQNSSTNLTNLLLDNLAWLIIVLAPSLFIQRLVLPSYLPKIARSQEYLFIFVISWLMVFASVFELIGFSLEVGALFGGILLAPTVFANEISSKIKPLRDFFLIIFFIQLGLNVDITSFGEVIKPALIMSAFVLLIKPLIVMISMGIMGFKSKVSAKTAFSLAQISEFSLILMALGVSAGVIDDNLSMTITLVALITIGVSTYLVTYEEYLLTKFDKFFKLFENKKFEREAKKSKKDKPEIILIGGKKGGDAIIQSLKNTHKKYVVIDFNPEIIKHLKKHKIPCLYGDLENLSIQSDLDFSKTVFVISTVSDLSANLSALHFFTQNYPEIHYLCYAHDDADAIHLYGKGAAFVIVPHHVGGKFISTLVGSYGESPEDFIEEKLRHLRQLEK